MTIFSANTGSFERVTVNDTTNTTNYLDGSVTVAGGMSIQKDLRISGSMTINGLLTVVSMSSQYVTSSQYNVGVSKITVNDDDNVRFAGFSVFDSGSSSPATASIFWDSLNHKFLYENLSGSTYNSAILIAGPKNTGSLGSESGLTSGYVPYATGDDHIDNSVIYQSGSSIGIGTTTMDSTVKFYVNGNIYTPNGIIASTFWTNTDIRKLTDNTTTFFRNAGGDVEMVIDGSGRVGINTTTPNARLSVSGSANVTGSFGVTGAITGATSTNTINGLIINNGALSGVTTIAASSTITGASFSSNIDSNTVLTFVEVRNADAGTSASTRISIGNNIGNAALTIESLSSTNTLGENFARFINQRNAAMVFGTNGDERIRITATGQVNIGGNFTSTNNRLQISGSVAIGYTESAPANGLIVNGNVGIGITNPSSYSAEASSLVIGKTAADAGMTIRSGNTNAGSIYFADTDSGAGEYSGFTGYSHNTNTMYWGTNEATKMTLDSSGNLAVDTNTLYVDATNNRVGIGTASPAVPLEVLGASNTLISTFRTNDSTATNNAGGGFLGAASATAASRAATLWLDADGANFAGSDYFFIRKNGNNGAVDFVNYGSAAINFRIDSSETLRMMLDASGNVGIGTTSLDAKLQVSATTKAMLIGTRNTMTALYQFYKQQYASTCIMKQHRLM